MKQFPLLIISFFIATIVLTQNISKPFIGHHGWNGVQYSNIARNYLRYGLITTKLGQVENAGIVLPENFAFNTHYLPTFPLLLSLSFKLFGIYEWSARLVAIIFSLLTVILAFILSEKLIGKNTGFIASIFLISTPMFRYFGKMPVHEPIITALALFVIYFYLDWKKTGKNWRRFFLSSIALQLIGWSGFFLIPLLFIYDWIVSKKVNLKPFLPLFLSSVLIFFLHLLHVYLLTGNPLGGGIVDVLKFRLNFLSSDQQQIYGFTPLGFIKQEFQWSLAYFTRIQVALTAIFLFYFAKTSNKVKSGIVILLLIYGISYAAIFRNAAFIHEYLIFYLAPGIAIASTSVIYLLKQYLHKSKKIFLSNLIIAIVLILTFTERLEFLKALEATKMHLIGNLVGQELKEQTQITDKIIGHSLVYSMHFSKFTAFYADRNISYLNFDQTKSLPKADYQFIIKEYIPEKFNKNNYQELGSIYLQSINHE